MKIQDLKELKEMYEMELDDLHAFEGNLKFRELKQNALEHQIVMIEDQIDLLERKRKSKIQFITRASIIAVIVLFIIYLIV